MNNIILAQNNLRQKRNAPVKTGAGVGVLRTLLTLPKIFPNASRLQPVFATFIGLNFSGNLDRNGSAPHLVSLPSSNLEAGLGAMGFLLLGQVIPLFFPLLLEPLPRLPLLLRPLANVQPPDIRGVPYSPVLL